MKYACDHTVEDYDRIMSTNLESPYHICQLAYPLLKASGSGNIVFISSVAGGIALPAISAYAASKGTYVPSFWQICGFTGHGSVANGPDTCYVIPKEEKNSCTFGSALYKSLPKKLHIEFGLRSILVFLFLLTERMFFNFFMFFS